MSELLRSAQAPSKEGVSMKAGVTTADNFEAMRHAALSMFKQRTKDLTMVSALTAETEQVEKQNAQVQSTIQKLHEQKSSLEAQIESEERRVKEWEAQLREVHGMLAQMKEDQSVFSGIQRSSERTVATVQQFVVQYTGEGGEFAQLLVRAQNVTRGRTPSEWRNAANDVRRREAVLLEHIKQMEKQHVIAKGFMELMTQWSSGVWKQCPECESALHICEQLLLYDAEHDIKMQIASHLSWDAAATNAMDISMETTDTLIEAAVHELDLIAGFVISMEGECESKGLCCSIIPHDRVAAERERWLSVAQSRKLLQSEANEAEEEKRVSGEKLAESGLLSERVTTLNSQMTDKDVSIQSGQTNLQRMTETYESLLSSWKKAAQVASTHEKNIAAREVELCSAKSNSHNLETELDMKFAVTTTRWMALESQSQQLYTAFTSEARRAVDTKSRLEASLQMQKLEEAQVVAVRDACVKDEVDLRQLCETLYQDLQLQFNGTQLDEEKEIEWRGTTSVEGKGTMEDAAVQDLLNELLDFSHSDLLATGDRKCGEALASTGIEWELLGQIAHCAVAMENFVNEAEEEHHKWKQRVEEEISSAIADKLAE